MWRNHHHRRHHHHPIKRHLINAKSTRCLHHPLRYLSRPPSSADLMKVQQTIAACIGWRRKYQKPFELIGVGVKQFHSGERKAALATKLSSWKSAILFNARPVAREALRVKITDLVRARVRVCGACIDSKGRSFLSVFFFFFLIMNDTTKFRSSVEKVGNFRRLGRIGTSFSTGKVG